jgi:hypothetical protein
MLAVRFTPDKSTLQMLLAVRFYIMGDLESFNVWVLDSNRIFMAYLPPSDPGDVPAQIQSPVYSWTVTPASIGWVTLNVTSALNPIFLTDDFYVAIGFTVAEKPALGVDTTGARSNRSWFVDNQSDTGWVAYSPYAQQHGLPDGNLMIRAVTSPIFDLVRNTMTTTTMHAAQSHEFPLAILFPAGTVLAILAVAAVGVRQVRKRRHVGSGT